MGAAVKPYAMMAFEAPGQYGWDEKRFGPPKNYFSNDQGIAIIRYPSKIVLAPRILTPRLVTFQVRHSDYVQQIVHFELGPASDVPAAEAKVNLKKG